MSLLSSMGTCKSAPVDLKHKQFKTNQFTEGVFRCKARFKLFREFYNPGFTLVDISMYLQSPLDASMKINEAKVRINGVVVYIARRAAFSRTRGKLLFVSRIRYPKGNNYTIGVEVSLSRGSEASICRSSHTATAEASGSAKILFKKWDDERDVPTIWFSIMLGDERIDYSGATRCQGK